MKTFCQKCGSPAQYALEKPKFCSNCGLPFGFFNAPIKDIKKPAYRFNDNKIPSNQASEDDEDYNDSYEYPEGFSIANVQGLDIEIERDTQNSVRLEVGAEGKIKLS